MGQYVSLADVKMTFISMVEGLKDSGLRTKMWIFNLVE